jgi:hypothetical protein
VHFTSVPLQRCTLPQCLYNGALYLCACTTVHFPSVPVQRCTLPQCRYNGALYLSACTTVHFTFTHFLHQLSVSHSVTLLLLSLPPRFIIPPTTQHSPPLPTKRNYLCPPPTLYLSNAQHFQSLNHTNSSVSGPINSENTRVARKKN